MEVARLVEALLSASVGGSTHKVYAGKWKKWLEFMKLKERGPWLHLTDEAEVIDLLPEFMACRLFSFNNQQSTVRGYLAAIKFFHKLCIAWDLPTTHCTILAAAKGIDRIRGSSGTKAPQVRMPLTWSILSHGYHAVTQSADSGMVTWLLSSLSRVRTVRVFKRVGPSGIWLDTKLPDILPRRCSGRYQGESLRGLREGSIRRLKV